MHVEIAGELQEAGYRQYFQIVQLCVQGHCPEGCLSKLTAVNHEISKRFHQPDCHLQTAGDWQQQALYLPG